MLNLNSVRIRKVQSEKKGSLLLLWGIGMDACMNIDWISQNSTKVWSKTIRRLILQ